MKDPRGVKVGEIVEAIRAAAAVGGYDDLDPLEVTVYVAEPDMDYVDPHDLGTMTDVDPMDGREPDVIEVKALLCGEEELDMVVLYVGDYDELQRLRNA